MPITATRAGMPQVQACHGNKQAHGIDASQRCNCHTCRLADSMPAPVVCLHVRQLSALTGINAVGMLVSMACLHLWHACTCGSYRRLTGNNAVGMLVSIACLHVWHVCTYGRLCRWPLLLNDHKLNGTHKHLRCPRKLHNICSIWPFQLNSTNYGTD